MNCTTSNRVLDLSDLDQPFFRDVVESMNALMQEFPGLHLHPSKQWEYPWALENAALEPASHVLDAGCGESIFPAYLVRRGHHVCACDIKLDWRTVDAVAAGYVEANLLDLPFEDGQFDAVFCISVIEHLRRDQMSDVLWELNRVLRPGGRLLLTTDLCEDHRAPMSYRGPDGTYPVNWSVFDRELLTQIILNHKGFAATGWPDLDVDWAAVKEQMVRFHGYPYTSVGVALLKEQ
jgi:SAM-dependent methyltransferase